MWSNKITSTHFGGPVIDFPKSLSLPPTWATKVWNVKLQFPFVPQAACTQSLKHWNRTSPSKGGGWVPSSPDATVEETRGCRYVSRNKWVTYSSLSEVRGESTLQPAARQAEQTQGCRSRTLVVTETLLLVTEAASFISVWFSIKLEIPEKTSHKPFCFISKMWDPSIEVSGY